VTLFEAVCDPENLLRAWQQVYRGKTRRARQRGAGMDGITLAMWEQEVAARLSALQAALRQQTYRPAPLLWFDVPRRRRDKAPRRLGIPTVTDRVAQRAVLNILEPLWEPVFLSCSHGFRPQRSVFTAVAHVLWYRAQGLTWVLNADIADFFNTAQHAILMAYLAPLGDTRLLDLLTAWLDVGAERPGQGLAQGAVLSPLQANIYLHAFDCTLVGAGLALVRYADDFVVMCPDLPQAQYALVQAANTLAALDLALNGDKTTIVEFGPDFEFLGAKFCEG
jgi:group II intron reverse transcriptase/maturase